MAELTVVSESVAGDGGSDAGTTAQAVVSDDPPQVIPPAYVARPDRRRLAWLAAWIAGAWLLSALAVAMGISWVLLPLLVVAVASVLRTGRHLLDRLMLSVILLSGAVLSAGLVFSLWPWGLNPFPIAGSLFTVVVVAAWAGGRRPRLPRSFAMSDLVVLGTGALVTYAQLRPRRGVGLLNRFPLGFTAEDRAAHFAIFDTIHRLGGFPFFHQAAARIPLRTPTESVYPAGTHFLYAVIDIFARSTTDPGPAIAGFDRYFLYAIAGYTFLIMSTMWAARWIITPLVGGWRAVAATSVVSAVLIGGPFMALVVKGFDSTVLGIASLVLTVALAVRPPHRMTDRLLLLGACAVLVAYTYYLYLPLAAVAILVSLLVDRKRVLRAWRPVAVGAAVTTVIAVVPLYFAAVSSLNVKAQAVATGMSLNVSGSSVVAAAIGSLLVLLLPGARRYRRIRVITLLVPLFTGAVALFGLYQILSTGRTSYYFDKMLMADFVVGIACSAPLAMFLKPMTASGVRMSLTASWMRNRLREVSVGMAVVVLAFTGIARFSVGTSPHQILGGEWRKSSLGTWFGVRPGSTLRDRELSDLARRGVLADGVPSLIVTTDDSYTNWRLTYLDNTLNRINGTVTDPVDILLDITVAPTTVLGVSNRRLPAEDRRTPGRAEGVRAEVKLLAHAVSISNVPLRVVLRDKAVADALTRELATRPGVHATILLLPGR